MTIIEEDRRKKEKGDVPAIPAYRVSILLCANDVIIKREYFYYGYYESTSDFDNFYYNDSSENNHNTNVINNLLKGSFITRKIKDKEYLKNKEEELIKAFYGRLFENEKNIKNELDNQIKFYNEKIERCHENQNNEFFIKFKRKDKLKKLDEKILIQEG